MPVFKGGFTIRPGQDVSEVMRGFRDQGIPVKLPFDAANLRVTKNEDLIPDVMKVEGRKLFADVPKIVKPEEEKIKETVVKLKGVKKSGSSKKKRKVG